MTYSQVAGLFRAFAGQPGGDRYLGAGAQVDIGRLFRAFAGQPGDNRNLGAGAHGGQGAHETRQSSKRSNPQRKPDGSHARLEVSASTYLGKTAGAT